MLLTADIGTSTLKSALWDYDGNRLGYASQPLAIIPCSPVPTQWLRAFENCCKKLSYAKHSRCALHSSSLAAVKVIVISGNGPTLVPVLGEPSVTGEGLSVPAGNVRLWLDRKAEKYQEEVSHVMGGYVDAAFFLPKILSIKNEEKELYEKVKHFLGCPEYLAYALTGQARTVFPSDGFDRWFWQNTVLEKLKLDTEKFPPFIRPGDQFGTLLPQVSDYLGLPKNIPVISGGPDFFTAILGAGVIKPGQVCDRTGSSEGINLCTQSKVDDCNLMSYGHPVTPYWNLSGIINTSGKAIEWASALFGLTCIEDFFSLARLSKAGSGGLIFHPHLAGERRSIRNYSASGSWNGINLSSNRADFANSVLEGICFAVRNLISVMEEACADSIKAEQLRVTGGMAGNEYLNQMKADITGKVILQPACREAELLGGAIIGLCYLGRFASFEQASLQMVRIENSYEPDTLNNEIYNELFNKTF